MPALTDCVTLQDLIAALGFVDAGRVARARDEAKARPLTYPLGSGEADQIALFAGLKPLVRQVLRPDELSGARERLGKLGLVLGEARHRVSNASTDGVVLFVGRDGRLVREAMACEERGEHDLELGRLLGYPRCCVEAYLEVPAPRRNVDALRRAHDASSAFFPRLNCLDLSTFHFISWLPCSFDCRPSKAYADAVAHHIAARHAQFLGARVQVGAPCPPGCRHERFVAQMDEALSAHRLLVFEDVQVSISGTMRDGVLTVERAWPSARDRHPQVAGNAEALEAEARVTALIAASTRVWVRDGVLTADGAPIFRTPEATLFPFGLGSGDRVSAR